MDSKRQTSENTLRTRIAALGKRLAGRGVSVGGSLACVKRKCGKAACRCAMDPEARHEAWQLTWKELGRTRSAYVPMDMAEEVSCWIEERRRLKRLLEEMDALAVELLKRHAASSRAKKGRPPLPK